MRGRLLHSLLFVSSMILFAEFASFVGLSLVEKRWFSFPKTHAEQWRFSKQWDEYDPNLFHVVPQYIRGDSLHPYVGFVGTPSKEDPQGFGNVISPIQNRSSDKVILAITGGSVAHATFYQGLGAIARELQKNPALSNKKIVPIRLTVGGYKQPQQLMLLNYLLSQGAQFDILINIDGFNEVALPPAENLPKKVAAIYPRHWSFRVRAISTPALLERVARATFTMDLRSTLAGFFHQFPFRYSVTSCLIWKSIDAWLKRLLYRENLVLLQDPSFAGEDYEATGPFEEFKNEPELYQTLADIWKRSSLVMHQISKENGIQYFHFLQPNQYVPGSKVFGKEEKKVAFLREPHLYERGVEKGYPYLIRAGKELIREGVHFYDLTRIFANWTEPIYIDDCCHFNEKGYQIFGTAIGKAIRQDYQLEERPTTS